MGTARFVAGMMHVMSIVFWAVVMALVWIGPNYMGPVARWVVTVWISLIVGAGLFVLHRLRRKRIGERLGDRRDEMQIKRNGSRPSEKGSADWFTGAVRIDRLIDAAEPARVAGASVTFEPGARTAWHTHPLGQTLIVTAGVGWAQNWGGAKEEIRPGDVIWFSAGEKHWHGATAATAMTHIAIQEKLDGKAVEWMEKVSDDQYQARDSGGKAE
jgi:quercetin dioxygenase-like cupin family protein